MMWPHGRVEPKKRKVNCPQQFN
uniref:Uncharacterized protein n=1 Tax=Anguilla anguilla TaxID=7936 RepID=A0A0E9TV29_ANGAN